MDRIRTRWLAALLRPALAANRSGRLLNQFPLRAGEGKAAMSGKTILYVEDNEANRMIARDLLKRTKHTLIEAQDGEARVAMALEKRPDLILMDIQLPKISGLEATRRLRTETATAATPIVAITSFALSGDDQMGGRRRAAGGLQSRMAVTWHTAR